VIRIVISIVLLVVLCVLVVLNLDYTSPVNMFWTILDRVSIVVVALVSFVAGVLYSFFLYAARTIVVLRKNALASRGRELDRRAQETADRESQAAEAAEGEPGGASPATQPRGRWRRARR
jgi:uncharacterized integral membrane protein